jgi:hypothetical protein
VRLDPLCTIAFEYTDFESLKQPEYDEGQEDAPVRAAWGLLEGTVSGERLSGTLRWSNNPLIQPDGVVLPNLRGVVSTAEDVKVFVGLTGRAVFVPRDGAPIYRQLLMALFESDSPAYEWLNNEVCIAEGLHTPESPPSKMNVYLCRNELL